MKPDRLDQVIRWLMVLVVLAIAAFAFTESYTHIYLLASAHHENGAALRMLPLSVDLLMVGAGLVMLHLRRKDLSHPLPRAALWGGAGVTLAANIGYGIFWGWLAALISAWAPIALFVAVELAMLLVRSASAKPEVNELSPAPGGFLSRDKTINQLRAEAGIPTMPDPEPETASFPAVTDGWGQLGAQQGASQGLTGIGLSNGRQ